MSGSSEFKGEIGTGRIEARFDPDKSNKDADILVIHFKSMNGGPARIDRTTIPKGGAADSVSVVADDDGILEVWVSAGARGDGGTLTVTGGGMNDSAQITDSVRWVYSVESGS